MRMNAVQALCLSVLTLILAGAGFGRESPTISPIAQGLAVGSVGAQAAAAPQPGGAAGQKPAGTGLAGQAPAAAPTTQTAASQPVSKIVGEPIDAGFVFIDNRYIDAPYVVSREEGEVFINGQRVFRAEFAEEFPTGDVDPQLPAGLTKDTSFYDPRVKEYIRQKAAYVRKGYPVDQQPRILEKAFRALPFVQEVAIDPERATLINLRTRTGELFPIALGNSGRRPLAGRTGVITQAEVWRKDLQVRLPLGDCFMFFSRGGMVTFNRGRAADVLPGVVEILRGSDEPARKIERLRNERLLHVDAESHLALAKEFAASAQLEARLAELKRPTPPDPSSKHGPEAPSPSPDSTSRPGG